MFTKKPILLLLTILLSLLMLNGTAAARAPGAATSTIFTYQGRLTDDGAPANGTYAFEFKLYSDSSSDVQLGSTNTKESVTVTNGLFTVQLDFGAVFDGSLRYLEIGVRPDGSPEAYTTLTPRQALTPAPYAIFAQSPQNVVVVAKSGGDFTSIQAALDSISGESASNPYLVYIAPGVYNERVIMKEYVDIEGAGEHATKITFTGSDWTNNGTVLGANNAELRFLTVENTGGSDYAIAIYNLSASPRLTHITANTSGVVNEAFSSQDQNFGIYNSGSSPIMTDMTINVSGEQINNGVFNYDSSPIMTNVTISAAGGGTNYGVLNNQSSPTMTNVTVSTSEGSYNIGINNMASGGSQTILVSNSKITGSTNTISNSSGFTVHISASQLSGGPVNSDSGTVTCLGVIDENYAYAADIVKDTVITDTDGAGNVINTYTITTVTKHGYTRCP